MKSGLKENQAVKSRFLKSGKLPALKRAYTPTIRTRYSTLNLKTKKHITASSVLPLPSKSRTQPLPSPDTTYLEDLPKAPTRKKLLVIDQIKLHGKSLKLFVNEDIVQLETIL